MIYLPENLDFNENAVFGVPVHVSPEMHNFHLLECHCNFMFFVLF